MSTRLAVEYDPKKLLLPDPSRVEPLLQKHIIPGLTAIAGLATVCMVRRGQMRPTFSGIQHHIASAGGGYAIAAFLEDRYEKRAIEKDAIYRHYIDLHPEDFPPAEPRKVGDIFKPWRPIR